MSSTSPDDGVLRYRVEAVEQRVKSLEELKPSVVADRLARLERTVDRHADEADKRFDELEERQAAQTRALVAAALSFAAGSGLFSLTVWQVFG